MGTSKIPAVLVLLLPISSHASASNDQAYGLVIFAAFAVAIALYGKIVPALIVLFFFGSALLLPALMAFEKGRYELAIGLLIGAGCIAYWFFKSK